MARIFIRDGRHTVRLCVSGVRKKKVLRQMLVSDLPSRLWTPWGANCDY